MTATIRSLQAELAVLSSFKLLWNLKSRFESKIAFKVFAFKAMKAQHIVKQWQRSVPWGRNG